MAACFNFVEYWDIGDASYTCSHCGALFWYEERLAKPKKSKFPKYSVCCIHGKIQIPKMSSIPLSLDELMYYGDEKSKHFMKNIRSYNAMFGFTSMGGKIDNSMNHGKSPSVFHLHGQNYHLIWQFNAAGW